MILPRRASLRSSKRNIEAQKTSSTCSRPQKKSRQHSSTTDGEPKMNQKEKVEKSVAQVDIAGKKCSSPSLSFSLKLTEVVNMVGGEDEVDSVTPLDAVDGYQVKPEYISILKKILTKYGDIARSCTILTMKDRSSVMEIISGIISELQEIDLRKIKEGFLLSKIAMVNELKNMKVEIDWLHLRLDEMLEARKLLERCVTLKEYKESNKIVVENAQRQWDECKEQKEEVATKFRSLCDEGMSVRRYWKEQWMSLLIKIDETIKYALSKVKRFINCSPVFSSAISSPLLCDCFEFTGLVIEW